MNVIIVNCTHYLQIQVKVVVATNAAESSVTIPDCDVVICLGTHKSLQYSALNHRTQLVNTW